MFRWSAVQINVPRQYGSNNVDFKKFVFLRCLHDLHFKYIFHKQSGSEIKVKVGVTDKGNGGQPACPDKWKKCKEEHE